VRTIDLTYVGRGIHEELVAYVADQQDYYEQEGVHVALRDGCGLGRRTGPADRHDRARACTELRSEGFAAFWSPRGFRYAV
jgi:hypothetical protein